MKKYTMKTRHALLMSMISLMTCFAMLLGTTFAWFTDSVTSGVNRIVAGNLDVEITHQTAGMSGAENVSSTTKLFTKDMNGKDLLWEPEVMAYETFTVSNEGTLALKYAMTLNNVGYNYVNGTNNWLGDVIQVAVTTTAPADRAAAKALSYSKTLSQFVNSPLTLPTGLGTINAGDSDQEFTIVLYWPQGVRNDNDYNLGHINGVDVKSSDGNPLYVNLGITLVATQESNENDSFGNTYDQSANTTDVEDKWAGVAVASAAPIITTNGSGDAVATTTVAAAPTTDTAKQTTVTLTAVSSDTNAAFDENSKLNLKVETNDVKASSSSTAFTVTDEGSTAVASIDLTLTKITTTTTGTEETQLTSGFTSIIDTYVATGLNDPKVAYNGDASLAFGKNKAGTKVNAQEDVDAVGEYWYDSDTGHLVFMTDHYSQYYVTTQDVAYIAATDTAYASLPEACAAAVVANGDVVVTLLRDASGNGWSPDNAKTGTYTLDFDGHTYNVTGLVGSTGTVSQAWRVIKGQNATLKNGTLTSTCAKMLINRYDTLVLKDMVLDGTKSTDCSYVLSNNNGTVSIEGNTSIIANDNAAAFDVYYWPNGGYTDGAKVTVNTTGTIKGKIEVARDNGTDTSKSSLLIKNGTFDGTFAVTDNSASISITGGTFSTDVKDYCAEGYTAVPNSGSKPTSWTVLSATDALAAKAKAAGATNIAVDVAVDGTGVVGTMSDGVVYKWYADGSVYVKDATNFAGETYTVPEFVTGLGDSSFKNNTTIKTLKITGNITSAKKALQENRTITTVVFGSKMTSIPDRMFYGCTGITSLTLPANITRIEDWAFYGNKALQSLTALGQIKYIGYKAFDNCSALKTLDIQGSPAIMGWAGRGASAIETIIIRGEKATVNLGYAPAGEAKGSYVFCKEQTGNSGTMNNVTIYVANNTVAEQFASEKSLGATITVGIFPNTAQS